MSMTLRSLKIRYYIVSLSLTQRCQWHCGAWKLDTTLYHWAWHDIAEVFCTWNPRNRNSLRKYWSICITSQDGIMKKRGPEKSWYSLFKEFSLPVLLHWRGYPGSFSPWQRPASPPPGGTSSPESEQCWNVQPFPQAQHTMLMEHITNTPSRKPTVCQLKYTADETKCKTTF